MCQNKGIKVDEVFIDENEGQGWMFVTNLEPVVLRARNGLVWIMPPLFSWCAPLSRPEDSSASVPPETEERSVSGARFDAELEKHTATPESK